METADGVTVIPITRARPPARPAHPLARAPALKLLLGAVLALALALAAVRSIRASPRSAAPAQGGAPPAPAAGAASSSARPVSPPMKGFRDEAPCELMGEPVECR
jgi:hypothetical protein